MKTPAAPGKDPLIQGRIIAYCAAVNAGVIRAVDGKRYLFAKSEWRMSALPVNDMAVAFSARSSSALNVSAA